MQLKQDGRARLVDEVDARGGRGREFELGTNEEAKREN